MTPLEIVDATGTHPEPSTEEFEELAAYLQSRVPTGVPPPSPQHLLERSAACLEIFSGLAQGAAHPEFVRLNASAQYFQDAWILEEGSKQYFAGKPLPAVTNFLDAVFEHHTTLALRRVAEHYTSVETLPELTRLASTAFRRRLVYKALPWWRLQRRGAKVIPPCKGFDAACAVHVSAYIGEPASPDEAAQLNMMSAVYFEKPSLLFAGLQHTIALPSVQSRLSRRAFAPCEESADVHSIAKVLITSSLSGSDELKSVLLRPYFVTRLVDAGVDQNIHTMVEALLALQEDPIFRESADNRYMFAKMLQALHRETDPETVYALSCFLLQALDAQVLLQYYPDANASLNVNSDPLASSRLLIVQALDLVALGEPKVPAVVCEHVCAVYDSFPDDFKGMFETLHLRILEEQHWTRKVKNYLTELWEQQILPAAASLSRADSDSDSESLVLNPRRDPEPRAQPGPVIREGFRGRAGTLP